VVKFLILFSQISMRRAAGLWWH